MVSGNTWINTATIHAYYRAKSLLAKRLHSRASRFRCFVLHLVPRAVPFEAARVLAQPFHELYLQHPQLCLVCGHETPDHFEAQKAFPVQFQLPTRTSPVTTGSFDTRTCQKIKEFFTGEP